MGWFTNILEAIDKPSNALQGLIVGAKRDDESALEGLKRGWKHEENYDFEQLLDEDLAKKAWAERSKKEKGLYLFTGLTNLVFDPLNVVPVGMLIKGAKAMRAGVQAGANVEKGAMKGLFTSSFPNYIPNQYGLRQGGKKEAVEKSLARGFLSGKMGADSPLMYTGIASPSRVLKADEAIKKYGVDKKLYRKSQKLVGTAEVGKTGLGNFARTIVDPEAMALFRSEGINQKMLTNQKFLSPKDREIEAVHRAFYNAHILEQSGRVGKKQVLQDFAQNLGVHGYQPYTKGSYHKLSKNYGGGVKEATKAEHKYIEKHITTVWEDKGFIKKVLGKKGVAFKDADRTKIFIKKGGHQDKGRAVGSRSGMHYDDITLGSKTFNDIAETIGTQKPKTLKELKRILDNGKYREGKPTFTIDEKTGNVWTSFSKTGTSITEGGVNAVAGFKLNGKFVLTVSDEHNFLENLPIVGYFLKKALPNRLLAVTPPMVDDLAKWKWKTMGLKQPDNAIPEHLRKLGMSKEIPFRLNRPPTYAEQVNVSLGKPAGHSWGEEFSKVATKKADPADILYEQGRLKVRKGYAGVGGGMLGTPSE